MYGPKDAVRHGVFEVADLSDVPAAIAPRPLLVEAIANRRSVRLDRPELERALEPASQAHESARQVNRSSSGSEPGNAAPWLIHELTNGPSNWDG